MALVPCKSCGEMISDLATTCPKCGAPVEHVAKPVADTSKVDMFLTAHGKELPEAQLPYYSRETSRYGCCQTCYNQYASV